MAFPSAKRLPEAILVLWTIFLAAAVWSHIPLSPQLPIYDTFAYYWKAYAFWSAVHGGHWFNPLNVTPAARPPGTVLMSYPFGFEQDFRGFYFRSIFFPAALMILAAYTVVRRHSAATPYRRLVVLIPVLFSTSSLFYYFAIAPRNPFVSYWGLVDGFLSGVAAFAAAAAWRCVRDKSIPWACIAAATSGLCMLIKPSGTMVAALIGVLWAALALARILIEAGASPQQRRADLKRYLICGAIIASVDALILAASLSTAYLSDANLAYGATSLKVLKTEIPSTLSAASLWSEMRAGPGFAFMLVTVLAILVPASALLSTNRVATLEANARLSIAAALAAFVALGFGVWFWLFFTGSESQVRYAMPFFAISMVWMVPAVTEYWRAAPRPLTACATIVMLAIPLNLALLLAQADPPTAWQRLSGISLDLGAPFAPTPDFRRFVEEPRAAVVTIYSFDTDAADQTMNSLALQHAVFHPKLPWIQFRRPRDWQRATTYRVEEIVSSNFLLFQPLLSPAPVASAGSSPGSFQDERAIFQSWASQLGREQGVEPVIDSPSAKLLRVVDKTSLRRSLLRMIAAHRWRAVFTEANPSLQ
jgi:hypothetical protein